MSFLGGKLLFAQWNLPYTRTVTCRYRICAQCYGTGLMLFICLWFACCHWHGDAWLKRSVWDCLEVGHILHSMLDLEVNALSTEINPMWGSTQVIEALLCWITKLLRWTWNLVTSCYLIITSGLSLARWDGFILGLETLGNWLHPLMHLSRGWRWWILVVFLFVVVPYERVS